MDPETKKSLDELFATLPEPVKRAITSADVQKQLRALADKHKLHLDQWEKLENEVLLGLFGLKSLAELAKNIQTEISLSAERAAELAGDISETVLAPIREELERELEHPEAKERVVSDMEQARTQTLDDKEKADSASSVAPRASTPETATTPVLQPEASGGRSPETPSQSLPPISPSLSGPVSLEKSVSAPLSSNYQSGEPSSARKNVHDDPYREAPA